MSTVYATPEAEIQPNADADTTSGMQPASSVNAILGLEVDALEGLGTHIGAPEGFTPGDATFTLTATVLP